MTLPDYFENANFVSSVDNSAAGSVSNGLTVIIQPGFVTSSGNTNQNLTTNWSLNTYKLVYQPVGTNLTVAHTNWNISGIGLLRVHSVTNFTGGAVSNLNIYFYGHPAVD